MPKYINFILKCGYGGKVGWNYLQKLVRWKDTRDVAWSESRTSTSPSTGLSFEEALMMSGREGSDLTSVLGVAESGPLPAIQESTSFALSNDSQTEGIVRPPTQENLAVALEAEENKEPILPEPSTTTPERTEDEQVRVSTTDESDTTTTSPRKGSQGVSIQSSRTQNTQL